MFCEKCGNKLPEAAKFCNKCGNPANTQVNNIDDDHNKPKATEEFAGFWIRLGAFIIDFAVSLLVGIVIGNFLSLNAEDSFSWGVLIFPVYIIIALTMYSTTFGKNIYGLKIVNEKEHGNINVGKAIGRTISYILSSFIIYMGFWTIGIDSKKQGWHDKLAGTLVIKNKSVDNAVGILFSIVAFGIVWAIFANM